MYLYYISAFFVCQQNFHNLSKISLFISEYLLKLHILFSEVIVRGYELDLGWNTGPVLDLRLGFGQWKRACCGSSPRRSGWGHACRVHCRFYLPVERGGQAHGARRDDTTAFQMVVAHPAQTFPKHTER